MMLKSLTPVGTAMRAVKKAKAIWKRVDSPTVNMWWAQTMVPRTTIPIWAQTICR